MITKTAEEMLYKYAGLLDILKGIGKFPYKASVGTAKLLYRAYKKLGPKKSATIATAICAPLLTGRFTSHLDDVYY